MIQSDALSRRPDHIPEGDSDNEDVILLPDSIFIKTMDLDLHEELIKAATRDDFFAKALLALRQHGTPPIQSSLSDWKFEDGILFFKGKCHSRRTYEYDTTGCEEEKGPSCPYLIEGPIVETGLDCILCHPRPRRKGQRRR